MDNGTMLTRTMAQSWKYDDDDDDDDDDDSTGLVGVIW